MLLLGAYHGINPGHGVALRGGAGDAGAEGERRGEIARAHCDRPRVGHRRSWCWPRCFSAWRCRVAGIRYPVAAILIGLGIYLLGTAPSPAMGPHAGRLPGSDGLVVSDGLGARRGLDGVAGAAGQQHGRSGGPHGGPQSRFAAASPLAGLLATGVHTIGYLAVTGLIAWVVYRKVGLALLRNAWFNLDVVWAAALVVTGVVTLVM